MFSAQLALTSFGKEVWGKGTLLSRTKTASSRDHIWETLLDLLGQLPALQLSICLSYLQSDALYSFDWTKTITSTLPPQKTISPTLKFHSQPLSNHKTSHDQMKTTEDCILLLN